jgi:hypothetical protein
VEFTYGSIKIDKQTFPTDSPAVVAGVAIQQNLFDVSSLTIQNFELIQAKPVGRALEITLLLRVPDVA